MTLLHEGIDSKKFDTRVSERNLERGLITQPELDKHLKSLPDDGSSADWVAIADIQRASGERKVAPRPVNGAAR